MVQGKDANGSCIKTQGSIREMHIALKLKAEEIQFTLLTCFLIVGSNDYSQFTSLIN